MTKTKIISFCVIIFIMLFLVNRNELTVLAQGKKVVNEKEMETALDSFFEKEMKKNNIPGAAVVVVKDGKEFIKKSYGFADVDTKLDFDKDITTFRIASITKVFTSTALMKLVEEGKVRLDSDIRSYLPELKIKNPYDKPITVENLLTHTSGIDSSSLKELSYKKQDMPCGYLLNEMNQKHLTVISEPGSHIEYCSYGVVLQGCIIEAVSGMSCKDYIAKNLLEPIKMKDTIMSMEDEKLSTGYNCINNKLKRSTLEGCFKLYPEGGLISSLTDMGHFIQTYLNDGNYGGQQILDKGTVENILRTHAEYDEILPGMCYGFSEYQEQGVRLVGHGGYAPDGFLSQLDLYPDENIGTFIVVNQGSNNNITEEFRTFFVSYLNMKSSKQKINEAKGETDSYQVAGTYRLSDYSKTTLCKGDAFGGVGEVNIKKLKSGKILISGRDEFTGKACKFIAKKQEPLKYKIKDSDKYVVFHTQGSKVINMAMSDSSWHGYYEKLSWYETSGVQMPAFLAGLLMYSFCILVFVLRVSKCFVFKCLGKERKITEKWNKIRYILITLISFMYAGFYIYSMFRWGTRLRYSIPLDVKLNLMMPIIGTVGVIIFGICVIYEWVKRKGRIKIRLFDLTFLMISIIFIFLFNYWNLLGFRY
ncbi:serine hydrolase domain-containing protein [Anaerosacchariphilus polymeriproducens]|nr:serine hydrolase domain-containing protein [Anaerosacchariphilus polymeriproducens]